MKNKKLELNKSELELIYSALENLCEDDYMEEEDLKPVWELMNKIEA